MELEAFFPYRLALTAEGFSRHLVAVYGRRYGLTREEWRLLFLIEHAGRIDSLRLGRRTSLDKVQVSRAAARLAAKGLITRVVDDRDRRLREFGITPEGRDLFTRVFAEVQARARDLLGALAPDDRAALERGVAALSAALEAADARSDA